jgi:hypothetical protein
VIRVSGHITTLRNHPERRMMAQVDEVLSEMVSSVRSRVENLVMRINDVGVSSVNPLNSISGSVNIRNRTNSVGLDVGATLASDVSRLAARASTSKIEEVNSKTPQSSALTLLMVTVPLTRVDAMSTASPSATHALVHATQRTVWSQQNIHPSECPMVCCGGRLQIHGFC